MNKLNANQIAAVMGLVLAASAAQAAGTSSAQFLKMGAGARAAGMGDAFCSVADDANGAYWNPAGLAQLKTAEASVMQNSYIQDTQYQYIAGAMPVGQSGLGAFIQRLDLGSIDRYTAADAKDGSFNAGSIAAGISLGMNVRENLMFGFTTKYIQESIESSRGTSFAGDFGMLYKLGGYSMGLAVQNVGPAMKMVKDSSPLPMTIRGGVSRRFVNDRLLGSLEVSKPNDNDASIHLGAEYNLGAMVVLRGGYKATPGNSLDINGITNVNGGLGLKFGHFALDYSISPFGDLGVAHRISLIVRGGSKE